MRPSKLKFFALKTYEYYLLAISMDVEPCYPLFSAELESAEALASFQQKFQTFYSNGPRHGDV